MLLNIFSYNLHYKSLFNKLYNNLLNSNNNDLLLLNDGVYYLNYLDNLFANNFDLNIKIYAIEQDIKDRKLLKPFNNIANNIINIDYPQFVELIIQYPKSITW